MEFKMENPLHSRNTNIVLQLLQELQIENETVELELAKESNFFAACFLRIENFLGYTIFCDFQ